MEISLAKRLRWPDITCGSLQKQIYVSELTIQQVVEQLACLVQLHLGHGFVAAGCRGGTLLQGEGMCSNLLQKCGLPVHVADVQSENVARLAARGAVASSVRALRETAHTVFLSLPSIDQVEEVCLGNDPLIIRGGAVQTVVDMSRRIGICSTSGRRPGCDSYLQNRIYLL